MSQVKNGKLSILTSKTVTMNTDRSFDDSVSHLEELIKEIQDENEQLRADISNLLGLECHCKFEFCEDCNQVGCIYSDHENSLDTCWDCGRFFCSDCQEGKKIQHCPGKCDQIICSECIKSYKSHSCAHCGNLMCKGCSRICLECKFEFCSTHYGFQSCRKCSQKN